MMFTRLIQGIVGALLLQLLPATNAVAQSPADEFARRRALEEQAQRLDVLKKITPDDAAAERPKSAIEPGGGRCFAIDRIEVEGVRQFPANRSQLNGAIEIFGGRADLVIANPNGITCDGCGFINTPRMTLTTGKPDIAGGKLSGLTVEGGDITFGPKGGNFASDPGKVDLFEVVSRSIRVDGAVYGKNVRLTAGRNKYNYADGQATALTAISGTPEFAIDGSALGAMQADRIKIVVTEKGAGVRMRGDLAANAGELSLSADGRISIGAVKDTDTVTIRSKSSVETGAITKTRRVVIQADKGITLQSVSATGDIDLAGGSGLLSVAGEVTGINIVLTATGISAGSVDAQAAATLIPNLGWATFLGGNFAAAVNAQAIADAGFAIEKIGEGYLIRITDHLNDLEDDYAYFSERRAELKQLFPDDFFLIKHEPMAE